MVLQKCEERKVHEFIQKQLEKVPTADTEILEFIAPYLIGIWYPETVSEKEIHDNGNCYHLSLLLKAAFPNGEICYAEPFGHTVFIYKEIPYDLEGVYTAWAEKFVPIQELEDQTRRNYVKH